MPVPSKADCNIPFLPGRSRYNVVNPRSDTWVYHRGTINGLAPFMAETPAGGVADPSLVEAGRVEWTTLTAGGLFSLVGNASKPLICSAIDAGGATLTLVRKNGAASRSFPTVFPCVIAPGEYVKATGGAAVGLLLRIDDATIL